MEMTLKNAVTTAIENANKAMRCSGFKIACKKIDEKEFAPFAHMVLFDVFNREGDKVLDVCASATIPHTYVDNGQVQAYYESDNEPLKIEIQYVKFVNGYIDFDDVLNIIEIVQQL